MAKNKHLERAEMALREHALRFPETTEEFPWDSLPQTIASAEKQVRSERRVRRLSERESEQRLLYLAGTLCIGTPIALICLAAVAFVWWPLRKPVDFRRMKDKAADRIATVIGHLP